MNDKQKQYRDRHNKLNFKRGLKYLNFLIPIQYEPVIKAYMKRKRLEWEKDPKNPSRKAV